MSTGDFRMPPLRSSPVDYREEVDDIEFKTKTMILRNGITLLFLFATLYCQAQEINQQALQTLLQQAEASHSDGVVIYHKGKLVGEWYFGKEPKRVDCKSVTKSITGLAVGLLVTQGKLAVDQKVAEFYPSWDQEVKRDISVRHLMAHTSGLLDSEFSLVENTPDAVEYALVSTLTHPVGQYHVYNNKAINLLAGIIEKAAGMPMDQWVEKELFRPLGITDFFWRKDAAGSPYCMAFLEIRPLDLAKIGQLLLQNGQWEGRQLISQAFIEEATRPAAPFLPDYGLLWELYTDKLEFVVDASQLQALEAAGVHPDFLAKARQMAGRYEGYRGYYGKVREVFGKDTWQAEFQRHLWPTGLHLGRKEAGAQWAFAGLGYLGQHLVVYPEAELVAVRLIAHYDGYDWETDELEDFPKLVRALVEGAGR